MNFHQVPQWTGPGSYLWLLMPMWIAGIIGLVTAHSARPDLVSTISSWSPPCGVGAEIYRRTILLTDAGKGQL